MPPHGSPIIPFNLFITQKRPTVVCKLNERREFTYKEEEEKRKKNRNRKRKRKERRRIVGRINISFLTMYSVQSQVFYRLIYTCVIDILNEITELFCSLQDNFSLLFSTNFLALCQLSSL